MAPMFIPIEHVKTKFYQKEKQSKSFSELSEEQLSLLAKKVYKKQEMIAGSLIHNTNRAAKLEVYQRTLQYLTNPHIHLDLKTFDERLAFLIMATDPDLVTFKEFLKIDLTSAAEIAKVENEKERQRLELLRVQTISTYQDTVRNKIGFFDSKLLKYEELFFKRFFSEKELITEVENNNLGTLIIKAKFLKDFNGISDKRYQELVSISKDWLALVPEPPHTKVAAYSVINQRKLLGLTNVAEQLALFILLIDENLSMLTIYEEESMMPKVEERIVDQFGYFDNELLNLERKFHNRFCPDKEISIWSK